MNLDKTPLVSFLIPFYNHNHFIKFTLDSIIEDTYENKEIIIINDGSSNPDDSNIVSWIKEHKDEVSINYIKRENKGVTKTLNELIDLSKGKYLAVCASDDYFINDTISKRVELLEENPHKLLLLSDNLVIDDNGKELYSSNLFVYRNKNKTNYLNDKKLKHEVISNWGIAGACYLINKELFSEVDKFDENLIVEDWDFFLRVAAKELILFYDERVSAYRLHDTNTINNPKVALTMHENQAFVAKKNLHLFSFPYNLYLYRRYLKYKIKVRKMKGLFPYNLSVYKNYKEKKKR